MQTSSAKPGERYWSLVAPVWLRLNESWDDDPTAFLLEYEATHIKVGHLYAAHWCQSEVCNGGLRQFFGNTTGILAPEALVSFQAIGISEWTELLREAMGYFGDVYPRARSTRQVFLRLTHEPKRRGYDPFNELDCRFFEWLHAAPYRWETAADRYAESS